MVEMYLGDVDSGGLGWVDITDDCRVASSDSGGGITITRQQRNEGRGDAEVGTAALTLNNRDGRYSEGNPRSPYFKFLSQNAPVNIAIPGTESTSLLYGSPDADDVVFTSDGVAVTGDIDIRVDVTPWLWAQEGAHRILASVWRTTPLDPDERSWVFYLAPNGALAFHWSPDGTFASSRLLESPPDLGTWVGRKAVRVTLDVDNGSGGVTVRWYHAPTIDGPWTNFSSGAASGTTSIYAGGTAWLHVGSGDFGSAVYTTVGAKFSGHIHAFQLRDGINGTVVANPDFTAQALGGNTQFTDSAACSWSVQGNALFVRAGTRMQGSVSELPPRWDLAGVDRWVPIQVDGPMRRLAQGAQALDSPLARTLPSLSPDGLWLLQDGQDARVAASSVPGALPATVKDCTFGSTPDGLPGASRVLQFNSTSSELYGAPRQTAAGTAWVVYFFFKLPSIPGGTTRLMTVLSNGTGKRWEVTCDAAGYIVEVTNGAFGADRVVLDSFSSLFGDGAEPDGWISMRLEAQQNGGNIDWALVWHAVVDEPVYYWSAIQSFAGTVGGVTSWQVIGTAANAQYGPIFVAQNHEVIERLGEFVLAANGYRGEYADERAVRLATEEGILLHVIGTSTERMGAQGSDTLLELLRACARADGGMLGEMRERAQGLYLRCRTSMLNQGAVVLDYSAGHIASPLEPTTDDQLTANDVTATREGGSSYRSVLEEGPMSIQPPPDGVGQYRADVSLNLFTDEQIRAHADRLRAAGTLGRVRYSALSVDLSASGVSSDLELIGQLQHLDMGYQVEPINLPEWVPPGPHPLLVLGTVEYFDWFDYDLTLVANPADLLRVGVVESTTRMDTTASELWQPFSVGTDTGLMVTVTQGPQWINSTDYSSMFPFEVDIGWRGRRGVFLNVTGIGAPGTPTVETAAASHGSNATLTPALPSIQDDDVLVLVAAIRNSGSGVPDTPFDWDRLPVFPENSNVQVFITTAFTGMASPDVTFTGGVANATTSAVITRLRYSVPQAWPALGMLREGHAWLNSSAQNIAYPMLRVSHPYSTVFVVGWKQDDWTSVATLAGATELFDVSSTTGDDQGLVCDVFTNVSPSDIPTGSFTVTGGASAISRAATFSLTAHTQLFTVDAAPTNGVYKELEAGDPVRLAQPWILD